eukprot:Gb_26002 [translate_table: standard]
MLRSTVPLKVGSKVGWSNHIPFSQRLGFGEMKELYIALGFTKVADFDNFSQGKWKSVALLVANDNGFVDHHLVLAADRLKVELERWDLEFAAMAMAISSYGFTNGSGKPKYLLIEILELQASMKWKPLQDYQLVDAVVANTWHKEFYYEVVADSYSTRRPLPFKKLIAARLVLKTVSPPLNKVRSTSHGIQYITVYIMDQVQVLFNQSSLFPGQVINAIKLEWIRSEVRTGSVDFKRHQSMLKYCCVLCISGAHVFCFRSIEQERKLRISVLPWIVINDITDLNVHSPVCLN